MRRNISLLRYFYLANISIAFLFLAQSDVRGVCSEQCFILNFNTKWLIGVSACRLLHFQKIFLTFFNISSRNVQKTYQLTLVLLHYQI